MTGNNDKIRSLILSALMVFSVFAGSIAFAGTAAANHAVTGDDADAHLTSGSTYWQGQKLFVQNDSAMKGDTYQVRAWDASASSGARVGSLKEEFTLDENKSAVIDTSSLDGDFVLVDGNKDVQVINSNGEASMATKNGDGVWEVTKQSFSAQFESDSTTDANSAFDVTFDSNRGTYNVTVSADGMNDKDLYGVFNNSRYSDVTNNSDDGTVTLHGVTDGSYATDFTGVATGNHTFNFDVTDTSASSSHTVSVSAAGEGDVSFADDVVQDQVGDVAEVTVQMENTDKGTIYIGSAETNYWITGDVKDNNGDGEVTVKFNTYAAGSDNTSNSDKLYVSSDSDDSVSSISEGGPFLNNNHNATDKLLGATEYEMNVTSGDSQAVGALSLQERSTTGISTWTAPGDKSLNDAETIAAGIGTNVTEASEIANGDYAVFNLKASGLEGLWALEGADATTVLNNNETKFSIAHTNPGANADAEDLNLASSNVSVFANGDNDTYYIAVDTSKTNDKNSRKYQSAFDVKKDSVLNTLDDKTETVNSKFSIIKGESSLDTNQDGMVVVEASENQSITGTSTWAPGTELSVTIKSKDTTSPFFTKPKANVAPDGTLSFTGDFSKLAPGTNLTFKLASNDKVDGKVVEQKSETTETATPEDTATPTETATPTATEEPTEASTDEPTEEQTTTEGSGPGFTIVAALGALIAAALLAARRSN